MTTPPVDDPETLRRILDQAEALFLDFDGPICSVFAGLSASVVVDQLCVVLADGGYGDPPPEIEKSSDPFDVLKYAAMLGETEAEYVNAAFTAHEVEAIATAEQTPGAHDLVRMWSQTGRPLAVVSNNSTTAVQTYLDLHQLRHWVTFVSARASANPDLLKPSPHLLVGAMSALKVRASTVLFVGDSASDIEASQYAGAVPIGYANRPTKLVKFASLQPAAIITSMTGLVDTLSG